MIAKTSWSVLRAYFRPARADFEPFYDAAAGLVNKFCIISTTVLFALIFNSAACNAEAEPATAAEATAIVASIIDGDTVVLKEPIKGAREVRLVGIQAPKLPLDRPNFRKWPLADQAHDRIAELSAGRSFQLKFTGRDRDRHGRLLAHMFRDDGLWLQGAMMQAGLARVYTFADNPAFADALLELERAARTDERGIWGHPYYVIRTPTEVRYDIGTFQIVEGSVLKAARVGQWVYLNFGPNWRTDFTVSVNANDLASFEAAGLDPPRMSGARIRVRGWVEDRNGPMITLDHPQPLEVIDP